MSGRNVNGQRWCRQVEMSVDRGGVDRYKCQWTEWCRQVEMPVSGQRWCRQVEMSVGRGGVDR